MTAAADAAAAGPRSAGSGGITPRFSSGRPGRASPPAPRGAPVAAGCPARQRCGSLARGCRMVGVPGAALLVAGHRRFHTWMVTCRRAPRAAAAALPEPPGRANVARVDTGVSEGDLLWAPGAAAGWPPGARWRTAPAMLWWTAFTRRLD